MSWSCTLAGHRAASETIENGGRTFSRCLRCGCDLVEDNGGWSPAPRGFRIVWKAAPAQSDLPAACEQPVEAPLPEPEAFLPLRAPDPAPAPAPRISDRIDRRNDDRRQSIGTKLPAFLNGRDRRLGDRRRKPFGRKNVAP